MKTANTIGKLQGLVYGKYIQQAKLYPNFLKFLLSAVSFGDVQLDIVSLKTVFAHHDPARQFTIKCTILTSCGVFDLDAITVENVHFTNSLDEKIQKIRSLIVKSLLMTLMCV